MWDKAQEAKQQQQDAEDDDDLVEEDLSGEPLPEADNGNDAPESSGTG